jgi:uncharacterized protein YcfL
MDFNPDTWGTVADWVGGLGTTAAFLITAFVVYRDAKVRKLAQARKIVYVSEETEYVSLVTASFHNYSTGPVPHLHRYTLKNLSDEPIYRVFFYAHDGLRKGQALDAKEVVLPGAEFSYEAEANEAPLACFRDNSDVGWVRNIKGKIHPYRGRSFERDSKVYAE